MDLPPQAVAALIAAPIGVIGTALGALLQAIFGRRTRRDAYALKMLDVKLRAYEGLQLPLDEAFLSLAFVAGADGKAGHERRRACFHALRQAELPFTHVISPRVAQGLADLHDLAFKSDAAQAMTQADFERALDLLNGLRQAIRSDCNTDAVREHAEETLNRSQQGFLAKAWADASLTDTGSTSNRSAPAPRLSDK